MAQRSIDGRLAVDRAGVAGHTGASRKTVDHWHRHRGRFGFPEGFPHEGRMWFWLDDIKAFHGAHLAAKKAALTEVDRSGRPNDRVTSGGAAAILGYASFRNLPDELLDHPDDQEILPDGRIRRYWYRRTVWAHADGRTGRQSTGRPVGATSGPRKPHPYADDPRLDAALDLIRQARAAGRSERGLGKTLAERLDIPERTAQRIIGVAATLSAEADDAEHRSTRTKSTP
ncbi:hypothetical protein KRMM14A1259_47760 [Krasilnikovia sp. MM14-A1259]